ncbi:nuclease-related domain-containing protein [Neiella marina]|uniref:nuclease-related domain-containing protein n=1 Tax=Neiella marina TaxID=508461 RepID=UPI001302E231|nr:nuclease-related domain-containing protein [Neiella marina]
MPTQANIAPTEPITLSALALYFVGVMVLLILAPAILRRKLPAIKGWLGEALVKRALAKHLPPERYTILHDVTLPLEDGGTTQIDHIVFSPYGIFVIETKNMAGRIYGNQHQSMWTQRIGGQSFRFQNPLRQNYKHTKALAMLLNVAHEQFRSVIVFTDAAQLKTKMPSNVGKPAAMALYIKSFSERIIDTDEVKHIAQHLNHVRLERSAKTNRAHINYLEKTRN